MPDTLTTKQLMWLCVLYEKEARPGLAHIPLLEGMIGLCQEPTHAMHDICFECHGLGWTPTKDVWKWLAEVKRLFPHNRYTPHNVQEEVEALMDSAMDGKNDFFAEFTNHLRPLAINAAEAEAWVRRNVNG